MSSTPKRRKEVYARAATQLRTHDRCFRAEERCPGAMGLYLFCLLQCRGEETWGSLTKAAVLSSWGGTQNYRKKQAQALMDVGLLEERDGQFFVVKYGEHNDTPDIIATNRAKERKKKSGQRKNGTIPVYDLRPPSSAIVLKECPPGTPQGQDGGQPRVAPISISISSSGSDGSTSQENGPPSWFEGAAATAAMQIGGVIDEIPARWASYKSSRSRKGWAMNHEDAVGWLCDVVRSERRESAAKPPRSIRPQDIVQPEIPGSWKMPWEMP